MSKLRPFTVAVSAVVGLALLASNAFAGAYPTNTCVAAKLKAAAKKCKSDLTLWSKAGGLPPDPNDLQATATKLAASWVKAETKATAKGADCTGVSLNSTDMSQAVEDAASDIAAIINPTLNLPTEAKCGANLLKAAAKKCDGFLKADSKYITKLAKDPTGAGRTAARAKAMAKFTAAYASSGCSAGPLATEGAVETAVDTFADETLTNTTTSPGMSTSWTSSGQIPIGTQFPYEGVTYSPVCSRNTPYQYWFKHGTVNKLLVYYQGGGACWDGTTCATAAGAFDDDVDAGDNPGNTTTGLGDLNNVNNPFRDWSAVFISYCTGDIHWGDNTLSYSGIFGTFTIRHRGYQNAKVVEKFAREHFVNPEEVFVTGSSAGAYGAALYGSTLQEVYPASTFNVVGDAGNGVVTPTFIAQNLEPSWKVQQHLPTYLGLSSDITTLTIADLYIAGANYYEARGTRYGQYTTAYDGGGGSQTFFYNVMVNGVTDSGNWWHSTCDWNTKMLQNDADALAGAPNNYRHYVGPGTRHTVYGSNRVYDVLPGVSQTFVDWLGDMRSGGAWGNVVCSDCSLLGACNGSSTNSGAHCQHDSDCLGGGGAACTPIDVRPNVGQNPPNPFLADGVVDCS